MKFWWGKGTVSAERHVRAKQHRHRRRFNKREPTSRVRVRHNFTADKQIRAVFGWHTWDSKFSRCVRRKFHCYANPSQDPTKMFFLILSRWRRQPCGGEASIHHEGIKIYWKMLVDCFQNNCYARKYALKWTETKNLAFLPVLQRLDTCFPFTHTHTKQHMHPHLYWL